MTTSCPCRIRRDVRFDPMNPAPPVMRMRLRRIPRSISQKKRARLGDAGTRKRQRLYYRLHDLPVSGLSRRLIPDRR